MSHKIRIWIFECGRACCVCNNVYNSFDYLIHTPSVRLQLIGKIKKKLESTRKFTPTRVQRIKFIYLEDSFSVHSLTKSIRCCERTHTYWHSLHLCALRSLECVKCLSFFSTIVFSHFFLLLNCRSPFHALWVSFKCRHMHQTQFICLFSLDISTKTPQRHTYRIHTSTFQSSIFFIASQYIRMETTTKCCCSHRRWDERKSTTKTPFVEAKQTGRAENDYESKKKRKGIREEMKEKARNGEENRKETNVTSVINKFRFTFLSGSAGICSFVAFSSAFSVKV